ncbi:MAG: flagellar hook capping FlgD N-terminal domain-containing protein [Formivibrio sp.]|nr:flagellar hook capping FlgD N-terminal domain-containing protein [Formivibrio sp.]
MATVSSTPQVGYDYTALNKKATTSLTDAQQQQDSFMKLLVTQLQNQDPTNPMDSAQTTSQIAQINMVSQLSKLNDSMSALSGSYSSQQTLQAAGIIGKSVLAAGSTFDFSGGSVDFQANITSGLNGGLVQVLDSSGRVVSQSEFGASTTTGNKSFSWDGTLADGSVAPSGTYSIQAYGQASDGSAVPLTTQTWQKVNSVALNSGSTQLILADGSAVGLSSVSQIR